VGVFVGVEAEASSDFAFIDVEFVAEVLGIQSVVGVLGDSGTEVIGFFIRPLIEEVLAGLFDCPGLRISHHLAG
jgi:hypothetical protein